MNLNSFRLKIAMLSGLITGLLLIVTGVVVWRISYQFNLGRLDREIRNLGQGNLDREHGPAHYQRFEDALTFISGEERPRLFLILVRDEEGAVQFLSKNWPTNLNAESFPALTGPLLPEEGADAAAPQVAPDWSPVRQSPPPERPEPLPPRREKPSRKGEPPREGQPPPEDRPPQQDQPPLPKRAPHFETRVVEGQSWRFGFMGNSYNTLVLGMNIEQFNTDMHRLRTACLLGLPVVLLLAGLSAWFLAQRALRPVAALTRTAEHVTARGLDQRIPAMARDQEFNRLITVFNEMMNRLEKSFQQATRFSADASHELKTPLARLQVELEQALAGAPVGSPQQAVYSSLLEEIHRLKAIVQKLLLLSLADAGRLRLKCEPVNLTRVLENVIEDCQAQAPHLKVEHDLASDVQVKADADLLEQALQNLASNAIKYNCEKGRIRFELAKEAGGTVVRVANTGPGIPAADRDRIFQRFYRADKSRSDLVDGVGLGLSLAREIVRAHGGELMLEDSNPQLTTFLAQLPTSKSPVA